MKQGEQKSAGSAAIMPPEFVSAVNLFAHPMAGAAAAGALGLGLASHAFGLWFGALAGAAEASQKLLLGSVESQPKATERKPVRLRLVESTPAPRAAAAASRSVLADAESIARNVVKTARKATEAALDDAASSVRPAAKIRQTSAPSKDAKPVGIARPASSDDLKAIAGIGPKLEKVLNDLGIRTYARIASLTPAEIADLDERLGFSGRIQRDDWIGQAAALAGSSGSGRA